MCRAIVPAWLFTGALVIDGVDGGAIQEAHQMIMHILCEACEHFSAPVR